MKWQQSDIEAWYGRQTIKRSYADQVVRKIRKLETAFTVRQYGALSLNPARYPLYIVQTKHVDPAKKTILVTGGVHGYETSGVHGALDFLALAGAAGLESKYNFVCAPCISPWAYETVNRWNAKAIDPNRSFCVDSPAEECRHFLAVMASIEPFAHFDLHETTDTDNTVFRPALAERDGVAQEFSEIPDGFYLVGDSENPQKDFQKAIIEAVRKVTHIAVPDENNKIIGTRIDQDGVINYPLKKLFLCAGFSKAPYTTTTEVYPDSPRVTDQICIDAQIAAIRGGLEHLDGVQPRATNSASSVTFLGLRR